ncbi:MAG TPA: hypothetical protein VIJ95_11420 [Hanamia sp.]
MPISSANFCLPSGIEVQNFAPLKFTARKIVRGGSLPGKDMQKNAWAA